MEIYKFTIYNLPFIGQFGYLIISRASTTVN